MRANPAWENASYFQPNELIGKQLRDLAVESHWDSFDEMLATVARGESVSEFELQLIA